LSKTSKKVKQVFIWSDGSATPNPGHGGWAAVLICDNDALVLTGYQEKATNNQMEVLAVLEALQRLNTPCMVTICSDSQYLGNGFRAISQGRVFEANGDLWRAIQKEYKKHPAVRVEHITAHRTDTHCLNKFCDKLAGRISRSRRPIAERYIDAQKVLQEASAL
jgi:ribonuclease HI